MDDIKSAREIAMEKIEKLGEATEEERQRWKYVHEGKKLAAEYRKGEGELLGGLGKYEKGVARYVAEGAADVLLRNINRPSKDKTNKNNKKKMHIIDNTIITKGNDYSVKKSGIETIQVSEPEETKKIIREFLLLKK